MPSMHSIIILALCCLQGVSARPTNAKRDVVGDALQFLGNVGSFSGLGAWSSAPSCANYDLSAAKLPTAPTPLPAPQGTLAHVAIGRGWQNYTCDLSNSTAVPVAIGALATLYNASCIAATSPALLSYLPNLAYTLRMKMLPPITSDGSPSSGPATNSLLQTLITQFQSSTPENYVINTANALMSGHHFFLNDSIPHFDLNTDNGQLGTVTVNKTAYSDAPSDATASSVQWLYLTKLPNYTDSPQDFSEVYRVNTVGGDAPTTCKEAGKAKFRVPYAAEYWFFR